jgi:hypothetical protein
LTTAAATKGPDRLRTGTFQVVSVAKTEIGMAGVRPAKNTSACPHDSGGPYFTESKDGLAVVVGVVSHGPDCPHTGADQASRIDSIAAWIGSVIATDASAAPSPSPSSAPTSAPSIVAGPSVAGPSVAGPAASWVPWAAAGAVLVLLTTSLWWRTARRRRGSHRRRAPTTPPIRNLF